MLEDCGTVHPQAGECIAEDLEQAQHNIQQPISVIH
jgi:hypothetical protein